MNSGFDEFSLALFTTLSPVGVTAFILLALVILKGQPKDVRVERMNRYLAIPFAVALIGFIASATHLGTPANALHVFSGVGRSPLSNEVFSAILFLFLGGSYWMLSFKRNFPTWLSKLWLVATCAAGIAFIAFTSIAYSVSTVPSWDNLYTPINLFFSALLGGPVLAILALEFARSQTNGLRRVFVAVSFASLIAGTVVLCLQHQFLAGVSNYEIAALDLAPNYLPLVFIHALLGLFGLALMVLGYRRRLSRRVCLVVLLTANVAICAAIFIMRISFYSLHLTVGF